MKKSLLISLAFVAATVNSPNETKYYYQDLDVNGARLNGANRYSVTFPKGETPPTARSQSTFK